MPEVGRLMSHLMRSDSCPLSGSAEKWIRDVRTWCESSTMKSSRSVLVLFCRTRKVDTDCRWLSRLCAIVILDTRTIFIAKVADCTILRRAFRNWTKRDSARSRRRGKGRRARRASGEVVIGDFFRLLFFLSWNLRAHIHYFDRPYVLLACNHSWPVFV